MSGVRERFISLPPKPKDSDIRKACLERLKTYGKKYGSLYVGVTLDPQKRFRQHNDRLKKPASRIQSDPWQKCVVILKTVSDRRSKKIERHLIKWLKSEYGPDAWNAVHGGGGRKPSPGSTCYVYVLLDKRQTVWKLLAAPKPSEETPGTPERAGGTGRPPQRRAATS